MMNHFEKSSIGMGSTELYLLSHHMSHGTTGRPNPHCFDSETVYVSFNPWSHLTPVVVTCSPTRSPFDPAHMMTSSNGNVTGPLWGESTSDRWIPLTKASDAELWCFLWSAPEPTAELKIQAPVIWDAIALIMTSLNIDIQNCSFSDVGVETLYFASLVYLEQNYLSLTISSWVTKIKFCHKLEKTWRDIRSKLAFLHARICRYKTIK